MTNQRKTWIPGSEPGHDGEVGSWMTTSISNYAGQMEFVTPEEVPEMGATSVVREEGRYAGVVTRGDIALGKIPTVKLEAKRRHYRNKANEMLEAVNSQLMNSSNSKMPISNNSKSRTFKGRTPTFQD